MKNVYQNFNIKIWKEDEFSNIESRRKATEKSIEKLNTKKIQVNIDNSIDSIKKSSFV